VQEAQIRDAPIVVKTVNADNEKTRASFGLESMASFSADRSIGDGHWILETLKAFTKSDLSPCVTEGKKFK
jgi:nitrogen fixation protein FixH